ncbi:Membrane-associated transporter protein [Habropoda laboriosa]|uniref:Membrane-associated transporter protein n=1 Tax=Habropoda laboriosa TaxID=597456 RepID=A0A0L7RCF6_9HYME|nr:Membrane-associated transporter protein [Habropoda laboriosa]
MVDKLHEYEGFAGRVHGVRDKFKEKWETWKEWKNGIPMDQGIEGFLNHLRGPPKLERTLDDYAHIYRKKTRGELVRVSAAVMGIEFSYAAETAFVSPTLLKIGVDHQHMTLVWALSPLIGFFVTPILGSLSDRCRLKYGRRRPFILLLAIGVLIGLILVPNGEDMGYSFGDTPPAPRSNYTVPLGHRTTAKQAREDTVKPPSHSWGIFFTILGTVLLDFDADACQSPARAYLLDVTTPGNTFTIMAGLGGFMGYGLGGINWDATAIGVMLGGHLHATFTLITIIFVICVSCTITSFKEIPLELLERDEYQQLHEQKITSEEKEEEQTEHEKITTDECTTYGTLDNDQEIAIKKDEFVLKPLPVQEPEKRAGQVPVIPDVATQDGDCMKHDFDENAEGNPKATLREYLLSIVYMPHSLRMVCLTNLFCWMAHVCYSLYFTDFVGEAVYGGDPQFEVTAEGEAVQSGGVRGLGTDVAIVSSMVFLAQFVLSCCLGTIVSKSGTTTAVVCVASTLAACGAISATQIMYLDL